MMFKLKKRDKMEEKEVKEQEEQMQKQEQDTQEQDTQEQINDILEKEEQEEEKELNSLGEKLVEINDRYLRLYSEFENYRKRTNKERLEIIENASEGLIKEILPIIDDFERALQNMENQTEETIKNTQEGMNLIYKKLVSALEKKGLKPINAKGKKFDENLHEAVSQIPAQNQEDKGKVFEEVQKGYYLNNKVIRYSKVVVSV